jgi:Ca2+-binding EF-hand superfamily protein
LKPHFEDFDTTKIGYITKNQFLRILDQFGVLPKNEDDVNLLLKKYVDKGNLNEVNYYEFVKDVDNYNEDGKIISKTHANSFVNYVKPEPAYKAYISNAIPNDLQDLLNRIRRKVKEQRIRVSEFLRDFDKLRSGTITKDQLRLGLTMSKIVLSDTEFKLILDYFNCPDKVGYVRSREFCDIIDEVFTKKNLEK